MPNILKMMTTPSSDSDMKKIPGDDLKIIVYSDLPELSNQRELLPNERDCVVILYKDKELSGHWTCLTRDGDRFTFFDSYGLKLDAELRWLFSEIRRRLNELTPYLTKLLSNENYVYTNTHFQQDASKIETCGDHLCALLCSFKNYNMDLEQHQEYWKYLKG